MRNQMELGGLGAISAAGIGPGDRRLHNNGNPAPLAALLHSARGRKQKLPIPSTRPDNRRLGLISGCHLFAMRFSFRATDSQQVPGPLAAAAAAAATRAGVKRGEGGGAVKMASVFW